MVSVVSEYNNLLTVNNISGNAFISTNGSSLITQMAFGPDGRLYASTWQNGVISFAYSSNSGTLSDKRNVVSINGAGIGFSGNTMYLSTGYSPTGNQIIRLRDENGNGFWGESDETKVNLVEGIPTGYHSTNQLQIIGNALYVGIGTRAKEGGDLQETSYGGSIAWIQDLTQVLDLPNAAQLRNTQGVLLSGDDFLTSSLPYTVTNPGKLVVYSSGTRNPYGLAVDASDKLWMTNNFSRADSNGDGTHTLHAGGDVLDADLSNDVQDQLFKVAAKDDYGYMNQNWRGNSDAINAGFFASTASGTFNASQVTKSVTYDALYASSFILHNPANPDGLGPSSSSNGFDFYKGTTLSSIFRNKAFITRLSGTITETDGENSLNYGDIVMVDPQTGDVDRLATGFVTPIAVLSTELGLLIADLYGGVYLISKKPSPATKSDFGGDGRADILWSNSANGLVALWQMNGRDLNQSNNVTDLDFTVVVDSSWSIAGKADFTGDSKADVLWRNTSGLLALWQMDGYKIISSSNITTVDSSWTIGGIGDFGGDGKADILWRNTNGLLALWQMDGINVLSSTNIGIVDSSWTIGGIDDFGGDGKADILWRNTNGLLALWQMDGINVLSSTNIGTVDSSWSVAGTGDFGGDGKADILWRNLDNGLVVLWQMNNGNQISNSENLAIVDLTWSIS